jgi:hypothetical protein
MAYLICRDLISWASEKYYKTDNKEEKELLFQLLPTYETYGKENISESNFLSNLKFDIKNKKLNKTALEEYSQPSHVYDRDLKFNKVPKLYYGFKYDKSKLFNFDGTQTDNFFIPSPK